MTTEEAIERLKERSAQLKKDAQDLRDDDVFYDDPDIVCNETEAKAIDTVVGYVNGLGHRNMVISTERDELKAALAASEAARERAEDRLSALLAAVKRGEVLDHHVTSAERVLAAALDAPATGEVGG